MEEPKYITGADLAAYLRQKHPSLLIVDVRDDDYEGGNIVGSVNVPSRLFLNSVDGLVRQAKERKLEKVVFHCFLSQQRGPKAARIFNETYDNVRQPDWPPKPEVLILQHGFARFQGEYNTDKELVENWDKEFWSSDWESNV